MSDEWVERIDNNRTRFNGVHHCITLLDDEIALYLKQPCKGIELYKERMMYDYEKAKEHMDTCLSRTRAIANDIVNSIINAQKSLEFLHQAIKSGDNIEDTMIRSMRIVEDIATIPSNLLHIKWALYGNTK